MKRSHIIVVGIVLLALFSALGYALMRESEPPAPVRTSSAPVPIEIPEGATVITLTEDGFVPSILTLPLGGTVTFITENGKRFWPASNLHPSHEVYPEFDPLLPINADESWSFTFTKVGEWKFHDHLAPYYTGVITVTE